MIRTLAAVLLLSVAPAAFAQASAQPPATASAASPSARLAALFAASDEASLQRNPLSALYRGDLRYADRFGDPLSDAYIAAERKAAADDLTALAAIDRSKLTPAEQVSYDAFRWQRQTDLDGLAPALVAASITRPIGHFGGLHTAFADISSGTGAAPFRTLADYDNGLKRIDGYVATLDEAIVRFRQGLAMGVTQPRLVVENVIGQLDSLIGEGVERSTFTGPVRAFPDNVPQAERARLTSAYRAAVATRIMPALTRLRTFLATEYLPAARSTVGLSAMPGGSALYAWRVRSQTTTELSPEQIHQLGLSEVARIRAGMEGIRKQVGFKGDLKAFFAFMRTDPRFRPTTAAALRDGYLAIGRRVDARVGALFAERPKAPLEIRPVPAYRERNDAAGSYEQGTPDGSRPGVFYYNTYDLPSRTTFGMETLYLHEAVPGHHFQISLAQENTALPPFLRFGGNTAYVEGWALYAESLGPELGLFTDPYQLYGHLDDEMLRAMRLVVDTGLHAKGWSRERAIAYMLDNSAQPATDVRAEVERYIDYPAQALAYKVGQLTIARLRREAEGSLGPRFDVRAFHAQVLGSGALPMDVLEAKIRRWVASQRGGATAAAR